MNSHVIKRIRFVTYTLWFSCFCSFVRLILILSHLYGKVSLLQPGDRGFFNAVSRQGDKEVYHAYKLLVVAYFYSVISTFETCVFKGALSRYLGTL